MNFKDYLTPVNNKLLDISSIPDKFKLANNICIFSPFENYNLKEFDLAILGIPEERNSQFKGCKFTPDLVRTQLYNLYRPGNKINMIDLGNISIGSTVNDTYAAVRDILIELLNNNIVPIIIGGSNDLNFANYLAYEKLDKTINIASIDSKINLPTSNTDVLSYSYLNEIIMRKDNQLFNFSNIGYQSYFVSQEEIDLANNLFFDYYRLGSVQSNLKKIEPILRDADIISFSMSSIKQSDAPGNSTSSPNGFYGEEACQIAKYAGISDKVSSFGLYDLNPKFDRHNQTTHLAAQIIWHFVEGFYQRKKDYPFTDIDNYQKFIVHLVKINHDLIFYKSNKTDRWWLEIHFIKSLVNKKLIVACSYEDYQMACNHEIPDRWWKIYQKIS